MQKCLVYLRIPWLGGISARFAMQITQTVQRCYFSSNVHMVFHTEPILVSIRKDLFPPHRSLIDLFRCSCGLSNIRITNQRLDNRIKHVPTKIHNFIGSPTDNLRNIYGSCMAEHLVSAEKLSVNFFQVLSKLYSSFPLKYRRLSIFCPVDSLFVNTGTECYDLILFQYRLQYKFKKNPHQKYFFFIILHDIFFDLDLMSEDETGQLASYFVIFLFFFWF